MDTLYILGNGFDIAHGISIPIAKFHKLPAGQYFMRVTAKNKSGETQYAFDYYRIDLGKILFGRLYNSL